MMTVKELIEKLGELPQDSLVVMSGDGEGTKHSPLSDLSESLYIAQNTWSGDLYDPEDLDPEDREGSESVICLWPAN